MINEDIPILYSPTHEAIIATLNIDNNVVTFIIVANDIHLNRNISPNLQVLLFDFASNFVCPYLDHKNGWSYDNTEHAQ